MERSIVLRVHIPEISSSKVIKIESSATGDVLKQKLSRFLPFSSSDFEIQVETTKEWLQPDSLISSTALKDKDCGKLSRNPRFSRFSIIPVYLVRSVRWVLRSPALCCRSHMKRTYTVKTVVYCRKTETKANYRLSTWVTESKGNEGNKQETLTNPKDLKKQKKEEKKEEKKQRKARKTDKNKAEVPMPNSRASPNAARLNYSSAHYSHCTPLCFALLRSCAHALYLLFCVRLNVLSYEACAKSSTTCFHKKRLSFMALDESTQASLKSHN
jgi:hypothetical protein